MNANSLVTINVQSFDNEAVAVTEVDQFGRNEILTVDEMDSVGGGFLTWLL